MKPEEMLRTLFPKQLVWHWRKMMRKVFSMWGVK